jgi:hypothetical protein
MYFQKRFEYVGVMKTDIINVNDNLLFLLIRLQNHSQMVFERIGISRLRENRQPAVRSMD